MRRPFNTDISTYRIELFNDLLETDQFSKNISTINIYSAFFIIKIFNNRKRRKKNFVLK